MAPSRFCDQCGNPLSADMPACPRCGAPVAADPDPGPERPVQWGPPPLTTAPTIGVPPPVQVPPLTQSPQPPRPLQAAPAPPAPVSPGIDGGGSGGNGPPFTRWAQDPFQSWGASFPGYRAWISAVMARNWRGTGVGIFCAWFDVPFVILMGGVGALLGGVAGTVSGTFMGGAVLARIDALVKWVLPLPVTPEQLLPTAAAEIGGILGGLWGALWGAIELGWMAFTYPWELLYHGDPMWPVAVAVGQVLTAVVVGGLYTALSVVAEPLRLRVMGGRRPSRREREYLDPILEEAAQRLGLTGRPRLWMHDSHAVNAVTGARTVMVYQGLIDEFGTDREALAGVFAHELVHWRDGDAIASAWGKGCALPLYLLYILAVKVLGVVRLRPLQFVLRVLLWSVLVTVEKLVIPAQAANWRQSEFRADQGAITAGYGPGLRRVLSRMRSSFEGGRDGWDVAICATHPPTELRLERLEEAGESYPLLDDLPVAASSPITAASSGLPSSMETD
jgi:Zn-dependent protease with chaperone function